MKPKDKALIILKHYRKQYGNQFMILTSYKHGCQQGYLVFSIEDFNQLKADLGEDFQYWNKQKAADKAKLIVGFDGFIYEAPEEFTESLKQLKFLDILYD